MIRETDGESSWSGGVYVVRCFFRDLVSILSLRMSKLVPLRCYDVSRPRSALVDIASFSSLSQIVPIFRFDDIDRPSTDDDYAVLLLVEMLNLPLCDVNDDLVSILLWRKSMAEPLRCYDVSRPRSACCGVSIFWNGCRPCRPFMRIDAYVFCVISNGVAFVLLADSILDPDLLDPSKSMPQALSAISSGLALSCRLAPGTSTMVSQFAMEMIKMLTSEESPRTECIPRIEP